MFRYNVSKSNMIVECLVSKHILHDIDISFSLVPFAAQWRKNVSFDLIIDICIRCLHRIFDFSLFPFSSKAAIQESNECACDQDQSCHNDELNGPCGCNSKYTSNH